MKEREYRVIKGHNSYDEVTYYLEYRDHIPAGKFLWWRWCDHWTEWNEYWVGSNMSDARWLLEFSTALEAEVYAKRLLRPRLHEVISVIQP